MSSQSNPSPAEKPSPQKSKQKQKPILAEVSDETPSVPAKRVRSETKKLPNGAVLETLR